MAVNETKVTKIFVGSTAPTVNKNLIWCDTSKNYQLKKFIGTSNGVDQWKVLAASEASAITIEENGQKYILQDYVLALATELDNKADASDLASYLPLTGGTIKGDVHDILTIIDTDIGSFNYMAYHTNNGITLKGQYEGMDQNTHYVSTHIGPSAITGDAVTSSITSGSDKLLTSGGAYTALQTKVNKGALHFNGSGYAQCSKLLRNQQFSFAVRIKANKNDVLIKKQVNIIDMGVFYLYIHSSVQRLSVYATGTGNSLQSVTTEQNNRIFDGNWHSLFVTYDGTTLTLSDEFGVLLTVNYSIQEQTSGTIFGANFVGQMQDICIFNFDMSADDAPYTIADYKNGKAIPPKAFYGQDCFVGGIEQSYSWLRTGLTMTSNITFDENGTNFIFDNTNGTSADYQVAVFNVNIPKGANVSIEGDWASIYTVYLYYGSVTPIQLIDNGKIINNHVTNTENCTALRIRPLSTGAGSTRTITLPPSCKIKVNGAILALEDYTFNGEVLDYSGNNNHATITGNVMGDNDSRVSTFIETIANNETELNSFTMPTYNSSGVQNGKAKIKLYKDDTTGAITIEAEEIVE